MTHHLRWVLLTVMFACAPERPDPVEACDNVYDDDGDGLTDCADDDCVGQCPELCTDALDNDGDAFADCDDPDCDGACPEDCADGRDNDGDFLLDCADGDCLGACPEDCANSIDDDGDQIADCLDPDCNVPTCPERCGDGLDNDADGLADCADPACDGDCPEACDDLRDNDGDGLVDCDDPACDGACPEMCTDGRDNDGDGTLDCRDADCEGACDVDGDGYEDWFGGGTDCDDTDAEVHPAALEDCNGYDDDCDALVDDDDTVTGPNVIVLYVDGDADGYGNVEARAGCAPAPGESLYAGDCADADPARHPAADEVCNNLDDDCDSLRDDDDPSLDPASADAWYADIDGDGAGDPASLTYACKWPSGYVDNGDDCHVFDPSLSELVNYWPDLDGDGFGAGISVVACVPPVGYAANGDDCDDANPEVHPDTPWYLDADIDGYGDPSVVKTSCTQPLAYVSDRTDCDDTDRNVNPGEVETRCDDADDDCDGLVDGADPDLVVETQYRDQDGDGLGDPASPTLVCGTSPDHVANADDNCPRVANPDQTDLDLDGHGAACDCADDDALLQPGVIGAWPSLLGAWQGDGDTTDSTGQYPVTTTYGDPTYTSGIYGEAFLFDGVGDWIKVHDVVWAGPFALSAWVRADALGQSNHTGFVSSSGNLTTTTFQVGIADPDEYLLHSDAPNGDYTIGPVTLDWVHVVVAFDGVDIHTWYDGVPVTTALWEEVNPPEFTAVRIGANRITTKLFTGAVDDLLLFDRALTDAEVEALYLGTATCLPL